MANCPPFAAQAEQTLLSASRTATSSGQLKLGPQPSSAAKACPAMPVVHCQQIRAAIAVRRSTDQHASRGHTSRQTVRQMKRLGRTPRQSRPHSDHHSTVSPVKRCCRRMTGRQYLCRPARKCHACRMSSCGSQPSLARYGRCCRAYTRCTGCPGAAGFGSAAPGCRAAD